MYNPNKNVFPELLSINDNGSSSLHSLVYELIFILKPYFSALNTL